MTFPCYAPTSFLLRGSAGLVIGHVASRAGTLGVVYEPGCEDKFLADLQSKGIGRDSLAALSRLLQGRPVKLHEYRNVFEDIDRLCDLRLVRERLRNGLEDARSRFERVHDRAMEALEERGLCESFVVHVFGLVPLLMMMEYEPPAGVRDVAYEFRSFVEDRGLWDLDPLVDEYIRAVNAVKGARILFETVEKGRRSSLPWNSPVDLPMIRG